jgi:ABC-type branched-subunit amino acid transport system substrate-binding protein
VRRLALTIVLAAVTAACGTTVPIQQQVASGTNGLGSVDGEGLAPGVVSGPTAGPGAVLPGGSTTSPGTTGGLASPGAGTVGTPGRPGATAAPTVTGGGIPATGPIQIGFVTTSVGNAEALGINAGQSYTDKAMFEALVKEYNAAGGVNGRRIVPVYGATDTGSSNWANDFAAVCAKFTQDNKVKAVIGYVFVYLPSFEGCLANAKVPHLYGGYQPGDIAGQRQFPTLVSTAHPTVDGAGLTALEGAWRSGVLTKKSKVGLVIDTCADGDRAYERTMVPWLKAKGINYQTVIGDCARGASDVSSAASAVSNAVLKFSSSGVDLVYANAVVLLIFMSNAQTQGYEPEYFTTVGGAALEANAPASQMEHLHGYGWLPSVDVSQRKQPGPMRASQKACVAKLQKHGLQPAAYNDFMAAYAACDGLDLYAKALASGATTPLEVAASVASAQPGLAGANTYDGRLRGFARQRGGPALYREYGWDTSCPCLTYRGGTHPVPSP